MVTVNSLGMTVVLILIVPTTHTLHGSGDDKSHKSSEMSTSIWSGHTAYYLLGVLIIVILQFVLIGCCTRMQKTACYKRLRSNIQGIFGCTENREQQSDDNSPPAYSNVIREDMQIVVIKSPPYVKDPPSYSEAVGTGRAYFTESIYI